VELPDQLRVLVGLALTLLLVMLRVEARSFGAAEFDEPVRGRRGSLVRRLAWYVLGIGGVIALLFVYPGVAPALPLTVGDRIGIPLGLALGGLGVAQAIAFALYHYHRIRLPDVAAYPGALANQILTAFIDEATFRGALFGYLLWLGAPVTLAIVGQAVAYTLATRTGAPGRDRYIFVLTLAIGLVAGWATDLTGGIGAAFLGHAITRVAVFLATGHAGQLAPRGTEPEDVARRLRTPEGWRAVERTPREPVRKPALRETGRDR
jgi:membrane protease YdiL (CAAX protease family)